MSDPIPQHPDLAVGRRGRRMGADPRAGIERLDVRRALANRRADAQAKALERHVDAPADRGAPVHPARHQHARRPGRVTHRTCPPQQIERLAGRAQIDARRGHRNREQIGDQQGGGNAGEVVVVADDANVLGFIGTRSRGEGNAGTIALAGEHFSIRDELQAKLLGSSVSIASYSSKVKPRLLLSLSFSRSL
jgi:hypothetical protein